MDAHQFGAKSMRDRLTSTLFLPSWQWQIPTYYIEGPAVGGWNRYLKSDAVKIPIAQA